MFPRLETLTKGIFSGDPCATQQFLELTIFKVPDAFAASLREKIEKSLNETTLDDYKILAQKANQILDSKEVSTTQKGIAWMVKGVLLETGLSGEKNLQDAKYCYQKGADLNNPDALYLLAESEYKLSPSPISSELKSRILNLIRQASQLEQPRAKYKLAGRLLDRDWVVDGSFDYSQAARLLYQAAFFNKDMSDQYWIELDFQSTAFRALLLGRTDSTFDRNMTTRDVQYYSTMAKIQRNIANLRLLHTQINLRPSVTLELLFNDPMVEREKALEYINQNPEAVNLLISNPPALTSLAAQSGMREFYLYALHRALLTRPSLWSQLAGTETVEKLNEVTRETKTESTETKTELGESFAVSATMSSFFKSEKQNWLPILQILRQDLLNSSEATLTLLENWTAALETNPHGAQASFEEKNLEFPLLDQQKAAFDLLELIRVDEMSPTANAQIRALQIRLMPASTPAELLDEIPIEQFQHLSSISLKILADRFLEQEMKQGPDQLYAKSLPAMLAAYMKNPDDSHAKLATYGFMQQKYKEKSGMFSETEFQELMHLYLKDNPSPHKRVKDFGKQ